MKTPVLLAALFAFAGAPSLFAQDAGRIEGSAAVAPGVVLPEGASGVVSALATAVPVQGQAAIAWGDDLEAAKAQAAKEGKDILVDFTGSDWCGWCIKLKEEVFDRPEFAAAAGQFVFVEADFPSQKQLPAEVKARNEKLQKEFGIRGFPTILLLDAKGRPFAKTGYQPGGPGPYMKALGEFRAVRVKRDAAWAKAEGAQGAEKAKLLAEGLMALDEEMRPHYAAVVAQIKALDPQDATGLVAKEELRAKTGELQGKMKDAFGAKRDSAAAMKVVDDFIAENKLAGEEAQKVAMLKLNVCPPNSLENIEKAIVVLDQVVAMGAGTETGKSAARIKERVPQMKARFEKEPAPKAETK